MLQGGNTSPYRLPCEGTVLCGNGPRYRHAKASEKNIPVYLYKGQVPDWATEDGMIDPYERINPGNSCDLDPNPCSGTDACPDPTSAAAPCLDWIDYSPDAGDCQYASVLDVPGASVVDGVLTYDSSVWYRPQMLTEVEISEEGESYEVGDILPVNGGTLSNYIGEGSGAATVAVSAVNGSGGITKATIANTGSYSNVNGGTLPASPNSPTGGHGTGASLTLTFGNQLMSLAQCFKYGFKNVQAMRQWHGVFGYATPGDLYYCTNYDEGWGLDQTCFTTYVPYTATPPQTKYTTVTASASFYEVDYSDVDGDTDVGTDDTYSLSSSVDATTGVVTLTDSISGNAADSNQALAIYEVISSINTLLGGFDLPAQTPGNEQTFGFGVAPPWNCDQFGDDEDDDSFKFYEVGDGTWTQYVNYGDSTPIAAYSGAFSVDATTSSFSYTLDWPDQFTGSVSLTISDSEISYSYYVENTATYSSGEYPAGSFQSQTLACTITLGGSNTASDVQTDITTLLDEWDLTDDALYPWRTDQNTSIAPMVTRNEVANNVGPPFSNPSGAGESYTDPNTDIFDGSIIGAPMPAGYQGYFDCAYVDYQICTTFETPGLFLNGWGQQNTGQNGLPLNATQWTNNAIAVQFCPGGWIFYNHNPSWQNCDNYAYSPTKACIAQKWAETKMDFPSQNFFRPAGIDRFSYDENNVYSITATTNGTGLTTIGPGSLITLEVTFDCANASLASTSGLWGGPAVGGFYEIALAVGNVVTLGTLVYLVPSDWGSGAYTYDFGTDTATSDAAYTFGLLRFSTGSEDPPAIPGRAGISNVAEYDGDPSVTELTTDTLTTLGVLQTGSDYVDIFDASMMALSSNQPVTRIDDSHFTIPVEPSTVTGAAWIMAHGAPNYYWDDQYAKGDYAYTDWTLWPRQVCEPMRINTLAETCEDSDGCSGCPSTETVYNFPISAFTQTAECLPFTPCNPAVICISPNSEVFANGKTFGFTAIDFDDLYGSGWQAQIQQVMEDLYYQPPHYPAQGSSCTPAPFEWISDDGSCQTPGSGPPEVLYFPHAPMVECRISLPDTGGADGDETAPALPTLGTCCGVQQIVIGWSSPAEVLSGATLSCTGTPGTDCYPSNTLLPPSANGLGYASFNVWNLWSNLCECVQDNGSFAGQYQNEVLGCS